MPPCLSPPRSHISAVYDAYNVADTEASIHVTSFSQVTLTETMRKKEGGGKRERESEREEGGEDQVVDACEWLASSLA